MSEWKTIESAPTNRPVLIWQTGRIPITAMLSGDLMWRVFTTGITPMIHVTWEPSHWMQIPTPPAFEQ